MRFAVLGAGGLGLVVAGYLARAGHRVVVVGKPEQAAVLKVQGVELVGPANFTTPVEAASHPEEVGAADYMIVAVKTRDTVAALDRVAGVEFGGVLSVQNGMAKDEQLAQVFGWPKVVGAATMMGATLLEPGKTHHTMIAPTYFGELDGSRSDRVERLAAAFTQAGMSTEIPQSILSTEWCKLIHFVPAALLSVASRLEFYKLCQSRDLAELFIQMVRECASVAKAAGVAVEDYEGFRVRTLAEAPFEEAVGVMLQRGAHMERTGQTSTRISLLQDVLKGRKTEVEETAGYVVRKARQLGVAIPNVEFGYRVVRAVESYF